jgi:glycosyltransferase involved in cell wall biosynthesis
VDLRLIDDKSGFIELARQAPADAVHIFQGLRGNGPLAAVQRVFTRSGGHFWVVMERVDDAGLVGFCKRLEYSRILFLRRNFLDGVLAIGWNTPAWLARRGLDPEKIFPFAYFLAAGQTGPGKPSSRKPDNFRFIFIGQFIELKRLNLLLEALGRLSTADFELEVIGSGPLESELRDKGTRLLGPRLNWTGQLQMEEIPTHLANADCLVLPSRYDGWGAVVSEALMAGTPVVCSDSCGAAGVVRASGRGGVFVSDTVESLVHELKQAIGLGQITENRRNELASWARCLDSDAGADYLLRILGGCADRRKKIEPPWSDSRGKACIQNEAGFD